MNIKKIKNKEANQNIFVLGNAPSVKQHDLSQLVNAISIGMNANPLLEEEFGYVSQYYVVSDLRFITHERKRKLAIDQINPQTTRIFRKELMAFDEPSLMNRTAYVPSIGKNGLSLNLANGFFFGCTTTMLAIQAAVYLGAKNIFIAGVDLRYSKENPRFYEEDDVQEYDPFTGIQLKNIHNAYLELKKIGVNLYNTEKKSLIDPYVPYISFDDALKIA